MRTRRTLDTRILETGTGGYPHLDSRILKPSDSVIQRADAPLSLC
jgi:hypothetical protein